MPAATDDYVPAAGKAWLTGTYDRTIALTMREPRWRPELVAAVAADVPRAGHVVEVGCGTGALTLALADERPDASVTGVDGDPQILALAQRKPGAERVTFTEALAQDLPLDDASADAVLCSLFLHHLPDDAKRVVLPEIARVLRPGGALHVADWGPPRTAAAAAGARTLQLFDGREGPAPLLAGDLPRLLKRAGFGDPLKRRAVGTVWGTLEIWRAVRP